MPVTLEPSTWYKAIVVCHNPDCEQYEQPYEFPELYSNADSDPRVQCYPCQGRKDVVEAVVLVPQPEVA